MERKWTLIAFTLFLAAGLALVSGQLQAAEEKKSQFFGIMAYRTGPFGAGGSGMSSGWEDFMALRNMEGGVNGIMYEWEECETAYNTARGVECYERYKSKMSLVLPWSTGITYALIDRATKDKKVVYTSGYGRTDASDGTVFPYVFTIPTNYWSQNSAKIKFIAQQMGGMDKLKGLKIANL